MDLSEENNAYVKHLPSPNYKLSKDHILALIKDILTSPPASSSTVGAKDDQRSAKVIISKVLPHKQSAEK
jgi:hypothetical protein